MVTKRLRSTERKPKAGSGLDLLVKLRRALAEPRLRGVDMASDELIAVQRKILLEKPMLGEVFREFYDLCRRLDDRLFSGTGMRIELGAGASLLKTFYPDVVSTDIKRAPHLDRKLDAHGMNLPDRSVRAVYGINCFHHLSHPQVFFGELDRVLVSGGGCVLIEPYYGLLAKIFYRRVFDTEFFDPEQESWETVTSGAMEGANQALSYIVFHRDRDLFERSFPDLEIVYQRRLRNYIRYLASGGLNFTQLAPRFLTLFLRFLEQALAPIDHLTALHHVIVLRKRIHPDGQRADLQ